MKKMHMGLVVMGCSALVLSSCSTMQSLHDKIAEMTVMKRPLADGSTIAMGTNIEPTAAWGCQQVGTPQTYDWNWVKTECQWHFKTGEVYLQDLTVDYANKNHLKANYAYLKVPSEMTASSGNGSTMTSINFNSEPGVVTYYQCKVINPEKNLGGTTRTDIAVTSNAL